MQKSMETQPAGCLILVKQMFAIGGMIKIPSFLARQRQNASWDLRKKDSTSR
jgi:hypothetical protein